MFYMHIESFAEKQLFFLVCVKKTKECLVKSLFNSTEIYLFCGGKIKCQFFTKLPATQIFQGYVHIKFYFGILDNLNHI